MIKLNIADQSTECSRSVTLANEVLKLDSITTKTFKTNKLSSFIEYMKKGFKLQEGETESPSYETFYSMDSIKSYPEEIKRDTKPVAKCDFIKTSQYDILEDVINRTLSPKEMQDFLKKMLPYGQGFSELLTHINNHAMEKVVSLSKSRDNKGNCSFQYSVKDSGAANSFNPPDFLEISIPIWKHVGKKVTYKPTFETGYRTVGDGDNKTYNFYYKIEMMSFGEYTEAACIEIMEMLIKDIPGEKYWGSIEKEVTTDEWKYKQLPFEVKGFPDNITNTEVKSRY